MHDRIGLPFSVILAAALPFLCAAAMTIVSNVPISIMGGYLPPPMLALMPVYFWCLVRPDLMPVAAAFAIGAFEDLLSGGPMGVWALSFVAAYALVDRERDVFAGMAGIGAILGFAASVLLACTTAFATVALFYGRFPPVQPLIAMGATTILIYLPGLWLLNLLHHKFVGPMRSDF
jgi:rod shape-determining protein MreD